MMKSTYFSALIIFLVVGCMPQQTPSEELESLRAQKIEIENRIIELESQVIDSTITRQVKVKYVQAKELKPQPFRHFIEVQGAVDTDKNVIVTSQSAGTIEKIHVKEGDNVKKGQLLITLDAEVLQNSISEVRTSLSFATEMYTKQKALWEEKIGSEVQYLTAKNNKESLEARLGTLRKQLEMTRVSSPIDGVVDNLMAKEGELTSPGMPMGRVVNLTNFEIKAEVAENYASRVNNGTKVSLWFPDLEKGLDGVVAYTGSVIDPVNRSFRIVVRLENPDLFVKPNMVCVVRIVDFETEEALVVPVSTILKTDLGEYVYVAEKNGEQFIASRRKITSNIEYNGRVMIDEGLKSNEWLITFGYQDLTDGDVVKF